MKDMNNLNVMVIAAGTVIHFNGIPVYVVENTRVMGCKENFITDGRFSPFITGAKTKSEEGAKDAEVRRLYGCLAHAMEMVTPDKDCEECREILALLERRDG